MKSRVFGIAWVWLTVLLTACWSASPSALTPLTVQLKWTHNAQFPGLYAADRNGDFQAEGLQAKLLEGGPHADALATIFRKSPTVFFALADTGITCPQDFVGKIIHSERRTHCPPHPDRACRQSLTI